MINKEFFGKEFTFPEKSKLFKNSVSLLLIYIFKTIYTQSTRLCAAHIHTNASRDTFFILI